MKEWIPFYVLPNVALQEPIEGGHVALVPFEDHRITALRSAHPNFGDFLERFTDAFGISLRPSVLLLSSNGPSPLLSIEAIASFRDLVAVSVIPYNRALELVYPRGHRILFSNTFWLYPWTTSKDYKYIVASTPAYTAVHVVSKFRGQCAPELSQMMLQAMDIDQPLLTELLIRWRRRYVGRRPNWTERALFRSLNMANQASQMPAGSDATLYDVGRSIALWVSAFEILAHPQTSNVNLFKVYDDLLEKIAWETKLCRHRRYRAYEAGRRVAARRPLACWLYGEIYKARNDFMHGNPVSSTRLTIKTSQRNLFQYAALLYRMALTGFLPLSWSRPVPLSIAKRFGSHIADSQDFLWYQRTIERGIQTARQTLNLEDV